MLASQTLFFDVNGQPYAPVPAPAPAPFPVRTSPWARAHPRLCWSYSDPYRATRMERVPAPDPVVIPEYNGKYRSRMQEWSYPRKRSEGFATLKKPKSALGRKSDTESTPTDQQGQQGPIAANKDAVISAHAGLVEGTVNQDAFLTTTRKFTLRRVSWRFKGTDQFGQTEDDITQIAMGKMWDALPTFKGTSGDFFAWYRKIINNVVKDAKRGSLKESKRHAPFYVETEDDEGNSEEVENPGIHGSIQFKRNGKPTFQDPIERRRTLPEFIKGDALKICQYRREGHSYARIGEIMGMTENAVTKQVQKMAKEIQEMRARGEKV
jgi:RNA polymerase sigma factor (sigma-70 family)